MSTSNVIKTYLKQIEDNLRAGNATEHTHRPALKTLLESPAVLTPITRYPVPGDNRVEKGYPKFTQAHDEPAGRVARSGRVHINPTQYFEGVPPEVWAFHVGGYQVLDKWLKDRRGRQLSYDDLTHYQRVVVALQRTLALMSRIDETIPGWPIK